MLQVQKTIQNEVLGFLSILAHFEQKVTKKKKKTHTRTHKTFFFFGVIFSKTMSFGQNFTLPTCSL